MQGSGVHCQGESMLTRSGERHLRVWSHLVLHLKVSVPHLLAAPSPDGTVLVAVMGPSQTCQQEQDGLNTLTGWSSRMLGCTHPRAGSNLGHGWAKQRWKAPHRSNFPPLRSVLPRPEAGYSLFPVLTAQLSSSLSKLSFPSLKCKGCHDSVSSIRLCPKVVPTVAHLHGTVSVKCQTSWLPDPACCFRQGGDPR